MKNIYKLFIPVLIGMVAFTGCDDMLEEVPSKQADIIPTKLEYLNGFFVDRYGKEINLSPQIVMSDDFTTNKDLQMRDSRFYSGDDLQLPATWSLVEVTNSDYNGGPWGGEYGWIYKANTILEYIPDVTGSDAEKALTRGDALFLRAYGHYTLAQSYCLPYKWDGSNANDLGLPIKKNTSLEDFPERSTLKELYDFILEDLAEAEDLLKNKALANAENGEIKQWRASAPAVYALQARVNLTMGNFPKALEYAQKAIDNAGEASLVDFNTDMDYALDMVNEDVTVFYEEGVAVTETIKKPSTSNPDFRAYDWKEVLYKRVASFRSWLVPSDNFLTLFGADHAEREQDLRYKYNYIENYSFTDGSYRGGSNPWTGAFTPALKIGAYAGLNNVGPSLGEMYLIKAECQARGNDVGGAQSTINELRSKRIDSSAPDAYKNLAFANQAEALKGILEERRREIPFYTRWFDLARLTANGETQFVPANITREFFEVDANNVLGTPKTFTFSPSNDQLKFAFPIPRKDIEEVKAHGSTLEQNKY